MSAGHAVRALAGWGLVLLGGCAQIFDIPQRDVDPTLDEATDALTLPTCERFCTEVDEFCRGTDKVYPGVSACIATCEFTRSPGDPTPLLERGDPNKPADLNRNTLICRYDQLRKGRAKSDPATYCPAVGLGGANDPEGYPCGSAADTFCDLEMTICPGTYANRADCIKAAAATRPFSLAGQSNNEGNSLQCRLYHLVASSEQGGSHCAHTAGAYPCCDSEPGTYVCKLRGGKRRPPKPMPKPTPMLTLPGCCARRSRSRSATRCVTSVQARSTGPSQPRHTPP